MSTSSTDNISISMTQSLSWNIDIPYERILDEIQPGERKFFKANFSGKEKLIWDEFCKDPAVVPYDGGQTIREFIIDSVKQKFESYIYDHLEDKILAWTSDVFTDYFNKKYKEQTQEQLKHEIKETEEKLARMKARLL